MSLSLSLTFCVCMSLFLSVCWSLIVCVSVCVCFSVCLCPSSCFFLSGVVVLFVSLCILRLKENDKTNICELVKNTDCSEGANHIASFYPLTNRRLSSGSGYETMFQSWLSIFWHWSFCLNIRGRNQLNCSHPG